MKLEEKGVNDGEWSVTSLTSRRLGNGAKTPWLHDKDCIICLALVGSYGSISVLECYYNWSWGKAAAVGRVLGKPTILLCPPQKKKFNKKGSLIMLHRGMAWGRRDWPFLKSSKNHKKRELFRGGRKKETKKGGEIGGSSRKTSSSPPPKKISNLPALKCFP